MATANNESTPKTKERTNPYTVVLGLTLLAITLACIALVIELRQYGNFPFELVWKTPKI
ncbi:hypothetical protein Psta_1352 [Pirellula staleyi DSM 6068]|uniref:Uncharacterized protein n=1 Tax=Pirellula staleyi (strain ATCC 27377 / DSM 6068 / ICPB 4128) TaxID=530564 RepID=D2QWS5_PIRSD|nr:hypothetical protein [Pirellula staleyi]ADB16029.1 hypothetical protein Psta_1352 [Pirellula staleyi DSM 6068]